MDQVSFELLTRLLEEHGPRLVLYARQWCSSPEDVVQEAFVRLMEERPTPQHPVGWLYRVVRNAALTASRSQRRRTQHESHAASIREAWFIPSAGDPLDSHVAAAALQNLPTELREPVILRLWSGMSFQEIAELTGTSLSTARRRYIEGLETLRNALNITHE